MRTLTRLFLAAILAAPGLLVSSALAGDLGVTLRGGAEDAALRQVYLLPFATATGIGLRADLRWDGRLETLRAHAKPNGEAWDLVQIEAGALQPACEEGLLEKIDWPAIGGKERYLPLAVSECGVGAFISATLLAWDRDKFSGTPGWAEFWDVARIPGKRGLFRGPRGNLEFSLLADGVAPADIYKLLRTNEGLDRAFRKLDQLRPFVVWWDASSPALDLLASGEVRMTSAPNGRISAASQALQRNFGMQWPGGLFRVHHWAIVKGSPNLRAAQQFLYFSGTAAIQARLLPQGGLVKGALDFMPAEAQALTPALPANLAVLLAADEGFWRENAEKLGQRFQEWLAPR